MASIIEKNANGTFGICSKDDKKMCIIENSKSRYKLVYLGDDKATEDMIKSVNETIKKKAGCELPIAYEASDDNYACEIVIGTTSGFDEEKIKIDRKAINENGFEIKAIENRIYIIANTPSGVSNGFRYFVLRFMNRKCIYVPKEYAFVCNDEYKIKELTISGYDIHEFVIECDVGASPSVNTAAAHLQLYIKKACGVSLEILADANGMPSIKLDHTNFFDDESFAIKTVDNGVIISGSPVRGLLYGVYRFLEQYIGWRFLPYDTDVLMADGKVIVKNIDYKYTPYFEFRDPFWCSCSLNRYAVKRLVNSSIGRNDDPSIGGFFGFTGQSVHTFAPLLGIGLYEQPCMSTEETYNKLLSGVMNILKNNPDARLISVSQNDTPNFCTCPRCTGKDIGGNYTDGLLRLINRIAEAVEKDYPKVKIHTLAYTVTREAPKVIKPRDNVVVQLCTIECCFRHELNDDTCERNRKLKKDIVEWSKVCKNIYVWDYTTDFRYYLAPFPNFRVLASNIRFFHEHNVKGLFEQGNEFNLWGEFGEMRAHLITQLMYDPNMSEEKYYDLIDEFMLGYYGAGWKYIRKYFDFIMQSSAKKDHFGIYATPEGLYCADDFINNYKEIDMWFDKALEMAENYSCLKHINDLRLHFTYLKWYFNYDNVMSTGDAELIRSAKDDCAELFDSLAESYIRVMDVRAPLGYYIDCKEEHLRVDKTSSPRKWDPLADTVNIPENGFSC